MAIIFDSVSYQNKIKNVSFNIEDGKITGIVGASNSGKSTLIDLMSGLLTDESNGIIFNDTLYKDIGVLYQTIDSQFFFDNIGREFFSVLKLKGKNNSKVLDSLKMFGFDKSILNKSPYELSLSEQKKISLALVLSFNPKILLLDEPTYGLDNKDKEWFIKLIRMMKLRYGKTIVIATKDTEIIHRIADNVILMKDGEVIKTGDKYDVLTDEKLLTDCRLFIPNVIKFSNMVLKKKNINLGFRDDINDLVKDIYRFVR